MQYDIHITDTTTGETRIYFEDHDYYEATEYQWSEGNYSCDCNRGLFFGRANGEENMDRKCGDSRYKNNPEISRYTRDCLRRLNSSEISEFIECQNMKSPTTL